MHSSISSSNANQRLPVGHWLTTWLMTLIICVTTVLGWEWYCRAIGFTANGVADNDDLWLQARKRASTVGKDGVIMIGASRIQLGINTDIMSHYTKTRPVQLAIDGSQFMPVLENLAADDSITGTVIVDLEMDKVVSTTRDSDQRTLQLIQTYNKYKNVSPYGAMQTLEDWLTTKFNSFFAFRITGANPQMLLTRQLSGSNFASDYLITLPDRSRQADYTKVSQSDFYLARLQNNLRNETLDSLKPAVWPSFEADIHYLNSLVQRIKKRGGRVVFVRFPTDKGIWQIDEGRFPREKYWNKLAATTTVEMIHFKDYPDLSRYQLPDGSHLDYRDAIHFTDALCKLIFKPALQTVNK